ncbi:hypothetical protein F2Q68_00024760 [Brassica cretica]|uniref:Autophagy-related protein 9 n=1 Tax=Brassica cretica TaxID=69181 RepID=A0A8S9IIL0_BRACR|nr:hypothetical protein F2Q68_00024760 [Brassica cretica]
MSASKICSCILVRHFALNTPTCPGRENPSGLLNGEILTVQPIADLDLFFERLYSYDIDKGLWCIIVKWAIELLSLGFIICVSGIITVLSNYGEVPSPGRENPSGLLNGEILTVQPIADLDLFFERLYSYDIDKGLWCIIRGLKNAKCGMDVVESGTKPCDLVKEVIHEHPLSPFTLTTAIIVGYLALFSVYWLFCFLRFFAQLKDTLDSRHFYYNR